MNLRVEKAINDQIIKEASSMYLLNPVDEFLSYHQQTSRLSFPKRSDQSDVNFNFSQKRR